VEGYLPTGRSLDAVRRFARALAFDDALERSRSRVRYGSGKSSLAIFLDALVSPAEDHAPLRCGRISCASPTPIP
jgi:hypothetical protein